LAASFISSQVSNLAYASVPLLDEHGTPYMPVQAAGGIWFRSRAMT
jgi:hypothetical protein